MKKLILSLLLVLFGFTVSAQKSNYEKYWQAREDSINKATTVTTAKPEYDDLYYQPGKDAPKVKKHRRADVDQIVDTLVKENPEIQVNYYYNNDPYFYSYNIGRFYHGGFSYWLYSDPIYYHNNFWMYDAYDWYWDMRFMGYPYWNYYPYRGFYGYNYWSPWRYNNYGYNNYNNHNNWYSHNQNFGGNYQKPQYGHYQTGSAMSNRRTPPQNRTTFRENNGRSYSPSYNQPRMSTRPQYNNSRVNDVNRRVESTYSRTPASTESRTYNRQPSTQSRTYSAPSRSYVESRSSNNGGTDRRSSGSYNGGSNYSSGRSYDGGGSRSSGSYSSGSSSSGGGGGSRSSGGSSSGGRR